MSNVLFRLLFAALAAMVFVSPAAAADLLDYDNGYAPPESLPDPYAYNGYPHSAYEGTYAPPNVDIRYPAPAYGRPDYRDVARYCEPNDGTVAAGYIPPAWCFPARPGASGPIDLPAPSIYGPRYPTPGFAHRRAPRYDGNDPYRARYEPN